MTGCLQEMKCQPPGSIGSRLSRNSNREITTFLLSACASQPVGPIEGGPSSTGTTRAGVIDSWAA